MHGRLRRPRDARRGGELEAQAAGRHGWLLCAISNSRPARTCARARVCIDGLRPRKSENNPRNQLPLQLLPPRGSAGRARGMKTEEAAVRLGRRSRDLPKLCGGFSRGRRGRIPGPHRGLLSPCHYPIHLLTTLPGRPWQQAGAATKVRGPDKKSAASPTTIREEQWRINTPPPEQGSRKNEDGEKEKEERRRRAPAAGSCQSPPVGRGGDPTPSDILEC